MVSFMSELPPDDALDCTPRLGRRDVRISVPVNT
jgi:hypothetical protein